MSLKTLSRTLTSANNVAKPSYVTTGLSQYFDAYTTALSTSSWTDRQGSSNITFTNSPTVSTTGAPNNRFVTFNGSSQYGTGFTSMVNLSTFSVYMWIKTTATTINATYYLRPCLIGVDTAGTGSNDWVITLSGGKIGMYQGVGTNDQSTESTVTYNDGTWHEIALTSSSTNGMKLFVDQVQAGSTLTVARSTDSSAQPSIGRAGSANANYAAFSCAVLMVYGSRELTTSDLAANRAYFRSRY